MYKVALIDDEHIIVEGLRRVLPWEKMGCSVVGMASDGVSGLDLIREKTGRLLSDYMALYSTLSPVIPPEEEE